jgi:ketosteroid isomerase-like protein
VRLYQLAALFVVTACGAAGVESEEMVRAAITDALERHAQAALRRDVPSAVSLFTSDATLMFPNSPDVVGRDSIGALMSRSWPAINPTKVRYATNEVTVLGDRAVSNGPLLGDPRTDGTGAGARQWSLHIRLEASSDRRVASASCSCQQSRRANRTLAMPNTTL